jgi:hypothetical protein
MSTPFTVPLTPEQLGLYLELTRDLKEAQERVNLFCAAVLGGKGITRAINVQLVNEALMGETPESP